MVRLKFALPLPLLFYIDAGSTEHLLVLNRWISLSFVWLLQEYIIADGPNVPLRAHRKNVCILRTLCNNPRSLQDTLGTYPRPSTNTLWRNFLKFLFFFGGMLQGYVGVSSTLVHLLFITNNLILDEVGDTADGKNPVNQLRLVIYPIIYKVLAPSQVVGLGISEPSTVSHDGWFPVDHNWCFFLEVTSHPPKP